MGDAAHAARALTADLRPRRLREINTAALDRSWRVRQIRRKSSAANVGEGKDSELRQ
jgi:hypothetical protein